jgi:hypothetical protein
MGAESRCRATYRRQTVAGTAKLETIIGRAPEGCDAVFPGATTADDLGRLPTLVTALKPRGAIWVVGPEPAVKWLNSRYSLN